jgi:hypothetical protein
VVGDVDDLDARDVGAGLGRAAAILSAEPTKIGSISVWSRPRIAPITASGLSGQTTTVGMGGKRFGAFQQAFEIGVALHGQAGHAAGVHADGVIGGQHAHGAGADGARGPLHMRQDRTSPSGPFPRPGR